MRKRWIMFHNIQVYILSFVALFFLNCKGGDKMSSEKNDNAMEFETLMTDPMCNHDEQTLLKIKSLDELQSVYDKINSTRKPGLEVPKVDFSKYDLAFYSPGSLSTGGHSLKVIELKQHHDGLMIVMGSKSPKAGEYATTVITSPGILIKFAKTDLPLKMTHLKL